MLESEYLTSGARSTRVATPCHPNTHRFHCEKHSSGLGIHIRTGEGFPRDLPSFLTQPANVCGRRSSEGPLSQQPIELRVVGLGKCLTRRKEASTSRRSCKFGPMRCSMHVSRTLQRALSEPLGISDFHELCPLMDADTEGADDADTHKRTRNFAKKRTHAHTHTHEHTPLSTPTDL